MSDNIGLFDVEYKMINVADIVPLDVELRKMDEEEFNLLCQSIEEGKFTEPIKVVKDGMKYRILDGNHRFMALKLKFDVKEVPCIVVGEMGKDYDEIRFWQEAIRTNNIKGEFNVDVLIQRAMWIYDKVRNKYDLNELRKRLGFTSKDDSFKQVLKTIESTLPAEAREKFREYSKKIKNPIELPKAIDKALKETYTNTDIQDRKQLMFVSEEQDRVVVMCDEELWHLVQELVLYIKNKGGDARNLFKMIIRNWLDGERHGKE